MSSRFWIPALALGGVGAIMAFTLEGGDRSIAIIRVRPLGVILLVMGGLFLLWGLVVWWQARRPAPATNGSNGSGARATAIKSIGGLVAVALGVGAVAALTIVALTVVGGLDNSSVVAISTSAFGVISAVVGAFMGIKIGTDQTGQTVGQAVDDSKTAAATVALATQDLSADQKEQLKQKVADAKAITTTQSDPVGG